MYNIRLEAGQTLVVLGKHDVLLGTDLIRKIYESEMTKWGYPDDHDQLHWETVEFGLSGWIGRTYQEYMDFAEKSYITHEIVRII